MTTSVNLDEQASEFIKLNSAPEVCPQPFCGGELHLTDKEDWYPIFRGPESSPSSTGFECRVRFVQCETCKHVCPEGSGLKAPLDKSILSDDQILQRQKKEVYGITDTPLDRWKKRPQTDPSFHRSHPDGKVY